MVSVDLISVSLLCITWMPIRISGVHSLSGVTLLAGARNSSAWHL